MVSEISHSFEKGVAYFFSHFGHRSARELTFQSWLSISLSRYIPPELVVAEINLPIRDLVLDPSKRESEGAINFDFVVSRSEIDCRSWKTRTPNWKNGSSSIPQTLETMSAIDVLAEMKIAASTATGMDSLKKDLGRLLGAIQFLRRNGVNRYPACYLIVVDPNRKLRPFDAWDVIKSDWPDEVPPPNIIVGP